MNWGVVALRSCQAVSCVCRLRAERSFAGTCFTSFPSKTGEGPNDNFPSFIPKPTWSIRSLQLNAKHAKLPDEELGNLAHRSLLDLHQLPKDLEQHLGNMIHMVERVSDFVATRPDLFDEIVADETGSYTYDFVRGVSFSPLRAARNDSTSDDDGNKQAKSVWESYLEPNTIRQGGAHQLFSLSTKQKTDV